MGAAAPEGSMGRIMNDFSPATAIVDRPNESGENGSGGIIPSAVVAVVVVVSGAGA